MLFCQPVGTSVSPDKRSKRFGDSVVVSVFLKHAVKTFRGDRFVKIDVSPDKRSKPLGFSTLFR